MLSHEDLTENEETLPLEISVSEANLPENKAPSLSSMSNVLIDDYIEKRYEITKSPNDKKLYRGLLLSNHMKVVLVSDPTTDRSAAAMDVHIGYMSDPEDLPGLAHFCEHMLFLGTEKYPQENEYNMFLSQNGGTSNAVTCMDRTIYYFSVTPDKLKDALDRFAQFFSKPLFTESMTELEINAINSEHEKNINNDIWRIRQVEKSSAKPNHPYSKFGTGNKETLDTIPKKKGINVREKLLEFHNKYYSANIMSLCILGKESLEELERIVVNLFSEVKNKEIEIPVWSEQPFAEEDLANIWYIVPIKDTRSLNMIFPIPDLRSHYNASPTHYISHLLGHEGAGSLLSSLKAYNWCNSLVAGRSPSPKGFSFFQISADLTVEGIDHIDDIIMLTFQYINMLKEKKPIQWIYEEYKSIGNMNFRFKEQSSPQSYVSLIAQGLHLYNMEDVLTAEHLFLEWDPQLITDVMEYLKPTNIRVHVVGKHFKNLANQSEKWYGTKFKKEKISLELIERWQKCPPNSDLALPSKNEFIPSIFDLKELPADSNKYPVIIEDTPLLRVWFKQDDEYLVPKANIMLNFVSPIVYLDPVNYNSCLMYVRLIRDSLAEYAYDAQLTGLTWEINNSKYGVELSIEGYDHKLSVLLTKIINSMVNFKFAPERFEILKENYIRELKNFNTEQPYQHAVYYLAALLVEQTWMKDELLEASSHITIKQLSTFLQYFLNNIHVECLVDGNLTRSEAIDLVRIVESNFGNNLPYMVILSPRQLLVKREVKLEDGCHFLFEVENKYHKSSCTEIYYQSGVQTTESNMLIELLGQIIQEPCFNILRTKEQLGYIVFAGVRRSNGVQGMRVIVQSTKHPKFVETRIDEFMKTMLNVITNMSDEEFNAHKESLADHRLEKPKRLNSLSQEFWMEISTQQYNFARLDIEIPYLRTITKEQLLTFFKDLCFNEKRSKFSVHVISMANGGAGLETKNSEENKIESLNDLPTTQVTKIDDIVTFKNTQHLYPRFKPCVDLPKKGNRSSKL
ncbi:PREDICTED: insulin-degrading enzyme isoform X1 [Polistes canadensis]|uniref:insulin-degrading enzyme isoform X1 n=1 Tax=Polistes canadensis TaxID=91411 RepID=UPI000719037D|nr:PREDICTED: insulin-degrading enzyme isoform X1 [Polistes canadensis]